MPAVADPGPALRRAVEALRRGEAQQALAEAQAVLDGLPSHPGALHLAGVALLRAGRGAEALERLQAAVRGAPTQPSMRAALAMARRELGDPRGAVAAIAEAGTAASTHAALSRELALALLAAGAREEALAWLRQVSRLDPLDFAMAQRLVDELALQVRAGAVQPAPGARAPAELGAVDIGFCSIDPAREATARATFAAVLGGRACNFHVIRDARSLAEAWNRLLDDMTAPTVILCHDDIELLGDGFPAALAAALARADIVGVAGARRVGGPAVLWAGHPHVHGWVTYPRDAGLEAAPLSFESGVLEGMHALDGVFLALRGEVARTLRFDAATFDGFHFYDLDFTYRAAMQGLRLAVSTDIRLVHASTGHFGEDWKRYAARFMAKHPALSAPQGSPHWYGARLGTRGEVGAFYDALAALDASAPTLPTAIAERA